jgi:hypothetical protein
MRDRALWLMIPTSCPLALGIAVAVGLLAAQTPVVYPESRIAREIWLGVAPTGGAGGLDGVSGRRSERRARC